MPNGLKNSTAVPNPLTNGLKNSTAVPYPGRSTLESESVGDSESECRASHEIVSNLNQQDPDPPLDPPPRGRPIPSRDLTRLLRGRGLIGGRPGGHMTSIENMHKNNMPRQQGAHEPFHDQGAVFSTQKPVETEATGSNHRIHKPARRRRLSCSLAPRGSLTWCRHPAHQPRGILSTP